MNTKPDPRVEFDELKLWIMEGYYDDCASSLRSHAVPLKPIDSLASIADGYHGVFERPIENLMLAVIFFVLGASADERWRMHWQEKVAAILEENDLEELLDQISDEEKLNLSADLRLISNLSNSR